MRFDGNNGAAVNYEPNSFGGPTQCGCAQEPPLDLDGTAFNHDARDDKDYYTQPGELFRLLPDDEKKRLMSNVAEAMDGVPNEIKIRAIARFHQADAACGLGIAKNLGFSEQEILDEVLRQQS